MTVPSDDDEVFRQIIAGYAQETGDAVPRWPVSEDADPPAEPKAPAPPPEAPAVEALPSWVEPAALADDGHYVPPEPPRLPHIRLRVVAATLILLLGLAAMLAPYRVGLDDSGGSLLLALLLCAAGGVLLVGSLRESRDEDDGPDDGAVV